METTVLERPVLGRITSIRESAARLRLVDGAPAGPPYRFAGDPPEAGPLLLAPPPELAYERFAQVAADARRAGREVVLLLRPALDPPR